MSMLQCHRAGLGIVFSLFLLSPLGAFSADPTPTAPAAGTSAVTPPPSGEDAAQEGLKKTFRRWMNENNPSQALEVAERGLKAAPDSSEWLFMKSQALTRLNRTEEAMEILRNLNETSPEMPAPYNNLAALHAARGELDEALRLVQMSLLVNPEYALGYENLGDIYLALARQAWNKSLKINPYNKALKAKAERYGQEKP
jgi:tetratricopeptide (TPR) repeat protein